MARFCFSDSSRFWRNGFTPMRKAQLGHVTAVHLRTSLALPQQQSRHRARRARRGFFSPWYRARISEGTSLGSLPTNSPPSAWNGDISRRSRRASARLASKEFMVLTKSNNSLSISQSYSKISHALIDRILEIYCKKIWDWWNWLCVSGTLRDVRVLGSPLPAAPRPLPPDPSCRFRGGSFGVRPCSDSL